MATTTRHGITLLLPPWKSRRLAGGIPGAALVVIEQDGHLAAIENPEPVTAAIMRFLPRLPERVSPEM